MVLGNTFGRNFQLVFATKDVLTVAFRVWFSFAEELDEFWRGNHSSETPRIPLEVGSGYFGMSMCTSGGQSGSEPKIGELVAPRCP